MPKIKFNIGGIIIERDLEEISQAGDKEIVLSSDQLVVYKKPDFDTYTANISKKGYNDGKVAGVEMAVKSAKEKHGLEFEGKDIDAFADSFKADIVAKAKIQPNEQIDTLTKEKKTLQDNYKTLETEFTEHKNGIAQKETRNRKDNELLGVIPEKGLKVSKKLALLALKDKGIDVDYDPETKKPFLTINGEAQKNATTLEYADLGPLITEKLVAEDLFSKPNGGRGGSDEPGGGSKSKYEGFVKEMSQNGVEEGSLKFNEEMNKRISDKTLEV